MLKMKTLTRQTGLKIQRNRTFFPRFLKVIIVLFILLVFFGKMFSVKNLFRRRKFTVQKDLLDYNDDGLRTGWPFQITKHYDMYDLRSYESKPRIISTEKSAGERGMPVLIPKEIMLLANWYSEYQINILASDKVSLKRSLPDFRDPKCFNIRYPHLLPTASVIMIVHNEAESVLMRAIWSVINRSPDDLLEELILIDDFSNKEHLKEKLEEYLPTVSRKIKLVRTEKRMGVVGARMFGAEKANGQVLIFLDANTECTDGWMEPLLSRIASDRSVVVTPRIDNINITTMAYEKYNDSAVYGLGWDLSIHLFPIPDQEIARNHGDLSAPYRTPALIGCAIAVDREFFFEIGSFDTGMHLWYGDAAELSIRVWQCGGAVEIVPCSRVGHYFRYTPYIIVDREEVILRNNIRTAEVWMDQYKVYFDTLISPALKRVAGGDTSERRAIRQKFKAKGFHWYLKNIFPASSMSIGTEIIGHLQRFGSKYCLDRLGRALNRQIGLYKCHGNGYNQGFSYQKNHQIVFNPDLCLGRAKEENVSEIPPELATNDQFLNEPNLLTPEMDTENHIVLLPCNSTNGDKWTYNGKIHQIGHVESGLCLATDGWLVVIETCNPSDERQHWKISSFDEYQRSLVLEMLNVNRP